MLRDVRPYREGGWKCCDRRHRVMGVPGVDMSDPAVRGGAGDREQARMDRRKALRRLATTGAAVAWSVPAFQSLGAVAATAVSAPPGVRGRSVDRGVRPVVVETAASASVEPSGAGGDALKLQATALNVVASGAVLREVAVRRAHAGRQDGSAPPVSG